MFGNIRPLSRVTMCRPPFTVFNSEARASPVVISVPHAGRDYPDLANLLQVPLHRLRACEDRFVDRLAVASIAAGTTAIVANTPRLWIDFNRSEHDLDPGMVAGGICGTTPLSQKARGGLGLIPRRLGHLGEIWRQPLTRADVAQRISGHHRPYHAALAKLLARKHAQFGTALLIDLHSMPSLTGNNAPTIVIGDRFGASAARRITDSAEAFVTGYGFRTAINAPYAGGYILERHAQPMVGIHALQIEIDRGLYLDRSDEVATHAAARLVTMIADLVGRLATELTAPLAIAAE